MIFSILIMTGNVSVAGPLIFVPLNLGIPFMHWVWRWQSPYIRRHAAELLNYQLLGTGVVFAVLLLTVAYDYPFLLWLAFYALLLGGMAPILIAANDAGNGGDGRYLVRIPLFK